jgi:xanthine dehydrogenase accessory factor
MSTCSPPRTILKALRPWSPTSRGYDVMDRASDILGIISARKAAGEPFALATVVRTVAATAAKAGAKAVILPDGTISEGWIGGGCARAAVLKAAKDALADGKSRLVSVQPPDLLDQQGRAAGEEQGGVRFASNMCPSEGTMDIFVEPVLPRSQIIICGSSPVAVAIADFAKRAGFSVTASAPGEEQAAFGDIDRRIEGYALPVDELGARFIVVSTQGRGDEAALLAALAVDADYVAFVGSRKKAESLKALLAERGISPERLAKLKAPAGLDLGAITPEEIVISILAEIVAVQRRKDSRGAPPTAA